MYYAWYFSGMFLLRVFNAFLLIIEDGIGDSFSYNDLKQYNNYAKCANGVAFIGDLVLLI